MHWSRSPSAINRLRHKSGGSGKRIGVSPARVHASPVRMGNAVQALRVGSAVDILDVRLGRWTTLSYSHAPGSIAAGHWIDRHFAQVARLNQIPQLLRRSFLIKSVFVDRHTQGV